MAQRPSRQQARQITPRQLAILRVIRDFRRKHGYAPTLQELADRFGVSKVTIFEHLTVLEEKGLLRRLKHRARSVELTRRVTFPDERPGALPLVGQIAAGAPIEAIEDREALHLEDLFAAGGERFVLRVRGESMVDEQIRDGDLVIVEKRAEVRDGETVVALLPGGEATLKRFYKRGRKVRLQPASRRHRSLVVNASEVDVQGVVVGVIRTY